MPFPLLLLLLPYKIAIYHATSTAHVNICVKSNIFSSKVNFGKFGLSGGESFSISSPETDYYFLVLVDGAGTDPAPAGKTKIEVDVAAGYLASDLATAMATAFSAVSDFEAKVSSDGLSVNVMRTNIGPVNAATADVDTTFTFEVEVAGLGGELGRTKEGIEVTFEATVFDVNANQTGTLLLDQIIQGTSASASMALLEATKEKLALVIGEGFGDKYTPAGGSEVVGFGTSKNFKSSFDSAGKLILHPVRLADTDRSEDVVFWKTLPLPESINYDGTDTKALEVSFNALVDDNKREEVSIFSIGDWKQNLLK